MEGIASECLTVTSFSRNRHPGRCHWRYYVAERGETKKIPDKILGSTSRARGGLGNATEHSARCEITFQKRVGWQSAFFIAVEMKLKTENLKRVKWRNFRDSARETRPGARK